MGALLRSRPAMGSERIDAWTREREEKRGEQTEEGRARKGGGEEGQKNNNNNTITPWELNNTFVKVTNLLVLVLSSARLHFLRAVSACGGEAGRTIGGEDKSCIR